MIQSNFINIVTIINPEVQKASVGFMHSSGFVCSAGIMVYNKPVLSC